MLFTPLVSSQGTLIMPAVGSNDRALTLLKKYKHLCKNLLNNVNQQPSLSASLCIRVETENYVLLPYDAALQLSKVEDFKDGQHEDAIHIKPKSPHLGSRKEGCLHS